MATKSLLTIKNKIVMNAFLTTLVILLLATLQVVSTAVAVADPASAPARLPRRMLKPTSSPAAALSPAHPMSPDASPPTDDDYDNDDVLETADSLDGGKPAAAAAGAPYVIPDYNPLKDPWFVVPFALVSIIFFLPIALGAVAIVVAAVAIVLVSLAMLPIFFVRLCCFVVGKYYNSCCSDAQEEDGQDYANRPHQSNPTQLQVQQQQQHKQIQNVSLSIPD